jgi:hypothetical protein
MLAEATLSVSRLDPLKRRRIMRQLPSLRPNVRALQLRGLISERNDRGFGTGIEDLSAQRRLALAVLHDRCVLS